MTIKAATSVSITSLLGAVSKTASATTEVVDIVANSATMANNWVRKHMEIQATDHKLELGVHKERSVAKLASQLADEAREIEKKSTDEQWLKHFTTISTDLKALIA